MPAAIVSVPLLLVVLPRWGVRVPFSAPVASPDALGPAVHRLLCAARRDSPGR